MTFRKSLKPVLLALTLATAALPAIAKPAPKPAAHPLHAKLKPCQVPGEKGKVAARCGLYEVWENRAAKSGRKIRLKVVLLPARSSTPKSDPVFIFGGGPGEAIAAEAGYFADHPLRRDRDLLFVDQRGTGEPDKLACELGGHQEDLQSYLGEMFPVAAVRECRERLAKTHDLTLYTTDMAIDDFDDARAWLGYGRINLWGGSYGTRAAQVFLRRHPGSVRSVVLDGAVPMDETLPITHAAAGQRSLDLLTEWCEKDAACHGGFPEFRREFQAVMDRLRREPAAVEVKHPRTGKPARVKVAWNVVADGVRWALYSPGSSAQLPLMIHQAAAGDFAPLAQASVNSRLGAIDGITMGLFFSVTCAEDIPFIDPAQVPARTANTFLGDYRVAQQTAACGVWPRARIEPSHREPVASDLPVLVINGERDPVTPPDFGPRVTRAMTHAVRVVIPWGSHGGEEPCRNQLTVSFIEKGSGDGLDLSCVGKIQMTPFVLEPPKEKKGV
ncbi:MAG TPA: alpha/beta fold hydrolase [Thermoanaerobaculia bacterium]|nr:alpha/beta fold hydrolase [Thermoanaerobaculia bacterium]